MKRYRQGLLLAALGVVTALATTACGENPTGPHTWRSTVTEVLRHVPAGPNTEVVYDTLSGQLNNAAGQPQTGTLFRESCNRKYVGNVLVQDWNCTALVNTGPHLYVGGGHANGITGELPILADPRVGGAMFIGFVGSPPPSPSPSPFLIQVLVEH